MNTDRIKANMTGVCPHCKAKAVMIIDSEGIVHAIFEHEIWCNVCPPNADSK